MDIVFGVIRATLGGGQMKNTQNKTDEKSREN
jgi:hypothetical protein